jgi:hypothetical protein
MEEKKENTKSRIPFKITKIDIIAVILLIAFLILVATLIHMPKGGCEVARPNYKCASFEDVMIENCVYWGSYDCDTSADASLPDIEWYIQNLCNLQNSYHGSGLDCSNLKAACNKITGDQTCPTGFT